MTNQMHKLKNTFTALISPMDRDGDLQKDLYQDFIRWQISQGVGLVPCGTTGEAPTLSHEEHEKVVSWCCELAQESSQKPFVLAGAGSNSTKKAIQLSRNIERIGADGLLIITPYYNRPTQDGLYHHYAHIAREISIPIIIYNVPSRTGVNILPSTVQKLAENYDNIVGYKAASGNLDHIQDIIQSTPKNFTVFSGDDSQTLEIMKLGGKGVISVASNLIPARIQRFTQAIHEKKWEFAIEENKTLHFLFKNLFLETNPSPVKFAAQYMGIMNENVRLPLVSVQESTKLLLIETLKKLNLSQGVLS